MKITELLEALTVEQEHDAEMSNDLLSAIEYIAALPVEERKAGIDKLLEKDDEVLFNMWTEVAKPVYAGEIRELLLKDLKAYIMKCAEDAAADVANA